MSKINKEVYIQDIKDKTTVLQMLEEMLKLFPTMIDTNNEFDTKMIASINVVEKLVTDEYTTYTMIIGNKDNEVITEFDYTLYNGQNGSDGITPHIGDNGNWFIGSSDTGVRAQGPQGPKGEQGDPGSAIVYQHTINMVGSDENGLDMQLRIQFNSTTKNTKYNNLAEFINDIQNGDTVFSDYLPVVTGYIKTNSHHFIPQSLSVINVLFSGNLEFVVLYFTADTETGFVTISYTSKTIETSKISSFQDTVKNI